MSSLNSLVCQKLEFLVCIKTIGGTGTIPEKVAPEHVPAVFAGDQS